MNKIIISLFLFLVSAGISLAEQSQIAQVEVEAIFDPSFGVGLLISSQGTISKPIKKTEKSSVPGRMLVSFEYLPSEIKNDTMATAMLEYLVEGTRATIFANLRPIFSTENKNSYLDTPACPSDKQTIKIASDSYGTLQGLIELRQEKKNLSKQEVQSLMSGRFLRQLDQLEVDFGLGRVEPLDAGLHPVELIDRLQRLSTGLKQNATRTTANKN